MLSSDESFEKNRLLTNETEIALRECDCIKYAAYRTAAKLRIVQKVLYMDRVRLKVISNVFDRHQLQQTENSVQLERNEVEPVLHDIYFVVQREHDVHIDIDYVSQLIIAFLFNVYDKKIKKTIQVLSFKIVLTLLCQAKPREKYHYLFDQMADHNKCLSRKKLEILLKKMISVTEYIGEALSFGSELILGTIESCFKYNTGTLGISEDVFINWLMQDPQLLVWLSTLYRMQISEIVSHNAKCAICKIYPMMGLRYRCLRCLSYDMCQTCFFTGKMNKKHKLKHPVQEYCCPMTSHQSTKAFLLTIRNRLYKKNSKLQYLPALRADSNEKEILGQSTRLLDDMEITSRTLINGSRISLHKFPYRELQSIIQHLEKESERLIPQIDYMCLNVCDSGSEHQSDLKNCLIKHKAQVETQIRRLKLLRNHLMSSSGSFETKALIASTPVCDGILSKPLKPLRNDLDNLSPISRHSPTLKEKNTFDKKLMWDNYDLVNYGINTSWEEIKSSTQTKNFVEISSVSKELLQATSIHEGSEISLSTFLGGKNLYDFDSSSKRGFTWLRDNDSVEKLEEERIRKENEETFQEIQTDLKKILGKLQDLANLSGPEEPEFEDVCDRKEVEIKTAAEVDTLLVDLINGIEKLLGP